MNSSLQQFAVAVGATLAAGLLLRRLTATDEAPSPDGKSAPGWTPREPGRPLLRNWVPRATDGWAEDSAPATDEEALARMLASETKDTGARTVIGWLTVQAAQRGKRSIYEHLTKGAGYGKQLRTAAGEKRVFYASTFKPATAETRELAAKLIAGTALPSAQIRAHTPGSWVERGQGTSDERIMDLQTEWKQGIYAAIKGTRWLLYSPDAPVITQAPFASVSTRLDAVPTVPAV